MVPIVHFVASFLIGIFIGFHSKHRLVVITCLSSILGLIDLDVFFSLYKTDGIRVFHNVYVFATIPLLAFLIAYVAENLLQTKSTFWQRSTLTLFVMMLGHMFLDLADGASLSLQYPLDSTSYVLSEGLGFTVNEYVSFTPEQSLLFVLIIIITFVHILETAIFNGVEGKTERRRASATMKRRSAFSHGMRRPLRPIPIRKHSSSGILASRYNARRDQVILVRT